MTVPEDHALSDAKNLALITCDVAYFDVLNCRASEHTVECGIVRNKVCSAPVHSDYVDEIELHKLRCDVAEALGQANTLAERGQLRGARDLLMRTSTRVRESIVSRRPLAVHLLETVQESLEGLQDQVTFKEHGKAVMQNYAGSHWQQRSAMKPTSHGYMKAKSKRAAMTVPAHSAHAPPPSNPPAPPPVPIDQVLSPYRNSSKMGMLVKHRSQSTQ